MRHGSICRLAVAFVAGVLLAVPAPASAHGDDAHAHPVAGGGGAMPPVVADAPAGTPAPGAQPAAPAAQATTPAADAAAVGMVDTTTPKPAATKPTATAAPVATTSDRAATTPAVAPVASGGGAHEEHEQQAEPVPVAAGGGHVTIPAAPAATPTGELPFTGVEDNILIISLAGMFVPFGVLLYCAARRGDLRRLRDHLARPRFEWTQY